MEREKWFYQKDGRKFGPFSKQQIKERIATGEIHANCTILHPDGRVSSPKRMGDRPKDAFRSADSASPPPPPPFPPPPPPDMERSAYSRRFDSDSSAADNNISDTGVNCGNGALREAFQSVGALLIWAVGVIIVVGVVIGAILLWHSTGNRTLAAPAILTWKVGAAIVAGIIGAVGSWKRWLSTKEM